MLPDGGPAYFGFYGLSESPDRVQHLDSGNPRSNSLLETYVSLVQVPAVNLIDLYVIKYRKI